jgi:hypothetical protein
MSRVEQRAALLVPPEERRQVEVQGHVDVGLGLVLALQALYIVDSIFNESSILSTMDITVGGRWRRRKDRPSSRPWTLRYPRCHAVLTP